MAEIIKKDNTLINILKIIAPGTKFRCGPNNMDFTLANCFKTKSVSRLAHILHDGYSGTIIDIFNRAHEYLIYDREDNAKGVYYNLPLK